MVTIHEIEEPRPDDISPFYDATLRKQWYAITVKGAPDVVLDLCRYYQRMDDQRRSRWMSTQRMQILAANDRMTQDALRVLGHGLPGIAPRCRTISDPDELEKDLVFAGLIGMIDPPRPEVPPALAKGTPGRHPHGDDHRRLSPIPPGRLPNRSGLLRPGHQVLTGPELNEMDDAALQREVEQHRCVCPGLAGAQDAHRRSAARQR